MQGVTETHIRQPVVGQIQPNEGPRHEVDQRGPSNDARGTDASRNIQPSISNSGMLNLISDNGQFDHTQGTLALPNPGNSMGLGGVSQVSYTPDSMLSIFDPVSAHIPLKIKEKIWRGEFIHLGILMKSARDLASESLMDGEFVLRGGILTVVNKKSDSIHNINLWTSAFIIYMGILLEKWPLKAQEYLKYMQSVRVAASRSNTGWVRYDEQYRLKKSRYPSSSWGVIDLELWTLCVASDGFSHPVVAQTPDFKGSTADFGYRDWTPHYQGRDFQGKRAQLVDQNSFRAGGGIQKRVQKCWKFNEERCTFGKRCKFEHKCSKCNGPHPLVRCRN